VTVCGTALKTSTTKTKKKAKRSTPMISKKRKRKKTSSAAERHAVAVDVRRDPPTQIERQWREERRAETPDHPWEAPAFSTIRIPDRPQ
jgi:hypothetical protein